MSVPTPDHPDRRKLIQTPGQRATAIGVLAASAALLVIVASVAYSVRVRAVRAASDVSPLVPGERYRINANTTSTYVFEREKGKPIDDMVDGRGKSVEVFPGQVVAAVEDPGPDADRVREVRIRVVDPPHDGFVGWTTRYHLEPE